MSADYDENRGKYFTEVVPKESVAVIIQTTSQHIHGNFHARFDNRLKDELNAATEKFIAVTDVTIFTQDGTELYRSDFMALNRDEIVWLIMNKDENDQTNVDNDETEEVDE